MSEFFYIINNGNIEEVKRIVKVNPNCVHVKDWKKWTPLDIAIEHGHLEMAKFLWEEGGRPNLDAYCDGEWTPVHEAALYGEIAILKWVFAKGVLPLRVLQIKDEEKMTPLDVAIAYEELETAAIIRRLQVEPVFSGDAPRKGRSSSNVCVAQTAR